MANKEKGDVVLTGDSLWNELEGKKEELKEKVEIQLGDVKGEVTVVFRDIDKIQKIEQEFQKKYPDKPEIQLPGTNTSIEVPNDENPEFNDHEKAQEWLEKIEPYRKMKMFRTAYEFIANDERPSDNPKEGTKKLKDMLRYTDAIKIVNKGMELSGVSNQLEEARKNS